MIMNRKTEKAPAEAKGATLVAENTRVTGDIHFGDQLIVNGEVHGNVVATEGTQATLTVSDRGRIEGQIRVPVVILNGEVIGDVHAEKHLELDAKARIEGNLYYRVVEVVKGARVQGRLIHVDTPEGAGTTARDAAQPVPMVEGTATDDPGATEKGPRRGAVETLEVGGGKKVG